MATHLQVDIMLWPFRGVVDLALELRKTFERRLIETTGKADARYEVLAIDLRSI